MARDDSVIAASRETIGEKLTGLSPVAAQVLVMLDADLIGKANGFRSSRDCARRTAVHITLNLRSTKVSSL